MSNSQIPDEASIRNLGLSRRTFHALERSGIYTVGELKEHFQRNLLKNIYFIGPKSIEEISRVLRESCSPLPTVSDFSYPDAKTSAAPRRPDSAYFPTHVAEPTMVLKRVAALRNWAEISQGFFESTKETHVYILLSRFGFKPKKLEQIAVELNFDRDRVKRIQTIVVGRYLHYLRMEEGASRLLCRINGILLDQGDSLSLQGFKEQLERENLLGNFSSGFSSERNLKIDPFETLMCWLIILSDSRYTQPPITFPVDLKGLVKPVSVPVNVFS